jgi:hypothetical protein
MIKTLERVISEFPEELQELAEIILNEFTKGKSNEEIEQIIKRELKEIANEEVTELESK